MKSPLAQKIESVDLKSVIEGYLGEPKRGKRYLCPFHNDTRPDLSIRGNKWKCFACGEGGNAVDFVMKMKQISFGDALKEVVGDVKISEKTRERYQKVKEENDIWARTERRAYNTFCDMLHRMGERSKWNKYSYELERVVHELLDNLNAVTELREKHFSFYVGRKHGKRADGGASKVSNLPKKVQTV